MRLTFPQIITTLISLGTILLLTCAPEVPSLICADDGDCLDGQHCNTVGLCSNTVTPVVDAFDSPMVDSAAEADFDVDSETADGTEDLDVTLAEEMAFEDADAQPDDVAAVSTPQNLGAINDLGVIEFSWEPVETAEAYAVYWATETGVGPDNYESLGGQRVFSVSSPVRVESLEMGVRVFGVVTAIRGEQESEPSNEADALVSRLVAVEPVFPETGTNWNDYVTDDGTACLGTEVGLDGCMHAGELRRAYIPSLETCAGVSAEDSLGAFVWTCTGGDVVAIESQGLAEDAGLSQLIDFDTNQWRNLNISITLNGSLHAQSDDDVWWSNPISVDNDGGNLDVHGTIYIVTEDAVADPFLFTANNVALLVSPGRIYSTNGLASRMVNTNGQAFLWIEGGYSAGGGGEGILVFETDFSVFRNVVVEQAEFCVRVDESANNRFHNITTRGCGLSAANSTDHHISGISAEQGGVSFSSVERFYLSDVAVAGRETDLNGLSIYGSTGCFVENAIVTNNGSGGVYVNSGGNNTLLNVLVTNSSGRGISLEDTSNSVLLNVASVNQTLSGISFYSVGAGNLLMNGVSINNTLGLRLHGVDGTSVLNLAVDSNSDQDLDLQFPDNSTFSGLLKVGSDCFVSGGTNPGLINGTCTDTGLQGSSTYAGQTSDAVLSIGIVTQDTLIGPWHQNDLTNPDDNNGYATRADIDHWLAFERPNRGWGENTSVPFPHDDQMGDCDTDCRIWDLNPATGDMGDSGGPVILGVLEMPTAEDHFTHIWSPDNEDSCSTATRGNWTGTACTSTFLINAVEILGDDVGNDNGLCESNEDCLFTPNIGAYQGHGHVTMVSEIGAGGTIENVTLYSYELQGYAAE